MITAGFIFTILITFFICKYIGKKSYMAREKPVWKNLIYWGGLLFTGIIFNMIISATSPYSYRLSIDSGSEIMYLILWMFLACFIIQLVSPSWIFGQLVKGINKALKKSSSSKSEGKDDTSSNMIYLKDVPVKNKSLPEKELGEKDFEVFLNTLCWLSFAFVLFVNLLSSVTNNTGLLDYTFILGQRAEYISTLEQLNHISYIMIFLTLPICVRQILFYLWKLRRPASESRENSKYYSSMYERYNLVQKHLKQSHKRL